MTPNQFFCPNCQTLLKTPEPVPPGTKIKCPRCASIFSAPVEAEPVAAEPAAHVTPRATVPPSPPPPPPAEPLYYDSYPSPTAYRHGLSGLSDRYSIDLGRWFQLAFAHYLSILGPMIGYTLLMGVVVVVLYLLTLLVVGVFGWIFLAPPLFLGYTIVSLAQLKGRSWSFGDFFSGFQWFGAAVGNALLCLVLVLGLALACAVPGIMMAVLAGVTKTPVFAVPAVLFFIVGFCVLYYVLFRAFCFCPQLIVDRRCGPWEAIQGSWTLSQGHFWPLFGISLLLGVINHAGASFAGVGILFTMPLVVLIWNAGYLTIAGTEPPVDRPAPQPAGLPPVHYSERVPAGS
jgi:hypothetical protein